MTDGLVVLIAWVQWLVLVGLITFFVVRKKSG
jgi:hypothetical protein